MYGSHRQVGALLPQKRREWWGRVRGADGRQRWIRPGPRRWMKRSTGPYLDARSELVAELADQVRLSTEGEAPAWAAQPHSLVPAELIAEVQVATQVDLGDLRPTGPPQLGRAAQAWQQQLDKRLAAADTGT